MQIDSGSKQYNRNYSNEDKYVDSSKTKGLVAGSKLQAIVFLSIVIMFYISINLLLNQLTGNAEKTVSGLTVLVSI
jgi:hypothetical protein